MAAHRPSLVAGGLLALALAGALVAVDGPPGSLLNRLPRSQWQQLPRGIPAPDFQLTAIAGSGLALADLKGRSSAVVLELVEVLREDHRNGRRKKGKKRR